jgi:hypothetical protein
MEVKYLLVGLIFALSLTLVNADIGIFINNICATIRNLLPIVALLLFMIAALIYGIGKVLGQEFRSKSESWAITIVIGAIIGLVLGLSAPFVIEVIYEVIDPSGYMEFTCEYME